MPNLQTLAQLSGKSGVFLMYRASTRSQCSGLNYLVSDGKRQWLGYNGKYYSEFIFEDRWLYEPTDLRWQNFVKGARTDSSSIRNNSALPKLKIHSRKVLLCDTRRRQ